MRSTTSSLRSLLATGLCFAAGVSITLAYCRVRHPEPEPLTEETALIEAERGYFAALEAFRGKVGANGNFQNRREQVLLRTLKEMREENCTSLYNFQIFNRYSTLYRDATGRDLDGVVLEIGPGTNLSGGVVFAMAGARKYYGLDIFRDNVFYEPHAYQTAGLLFDTVAPRGIKVPFDRIARIVDGKVEFERDRIEFLYPRQSYDIPLPEGSVDYLFSNSTLEHVADPLRTMAAIQRVLRPGGFTAHSIDLRDHRDFKRPHEFLKVDGESWAREFRAAGTEHLYTNRWRASDFRKRMEEHGFEIIRFSVEQRHDVTEAERSTFHPDFRNYALEDLGAVVLLVVARKP